jgi:hypothetical protein
VGQQTGLLFAGVGAVLVLATLVAETLRWRQRGQPSAVIANLVSRIAWWVMAIVVGLALFFGRAEVIVLFAIISLFALREFITLAPTRSGRLLRCWPRSTSCCLAVLPGVDRLVRHVHAADPGLCIPVPADPVDHRR